MSGFMMGMDSSGSNVGRFDYCMSGVRRRYGWVYTFHKWSDNYERDITVWMPLPEWVRDRIVDWWMAR